MRNSLHTPLLLTVICAALTACGGGSDVDSMDATLSSATGEMAAKSLAVSSYTPLSRNTATTNTTNNTANGTAITTVRLTNATATSQSNAVATFGQVFAEGDVRNGETLVGRTSSGVTVPLQVDVKARHADGSLRHAVITAKLPSAAANVVETVSLIKSTTVNAAAQTSPTTLLNSGFTASFNATVGGVQYTASADAALKSGVYKTWLSGPLVTEWLVTVPLKTQAGATHPHLTARFAIRAYAGGRNARVDVTVENGWAHVDAPQNFTYDAQVLVGGQATFTQSNLIHYHHARWRRVFWWGSAPALEVKHDSAYLIASKAVPNFDQSTPIKEASLAGWESRWASAKTDPMQSGVGTAYMPTTGSRADLGLMPAWSALYLLSMDQRLKNITLRMSEQAGSWSSHYRNKQTDRPVTLAEYPFMTLIARRMDTFNPATRTEEAFPVCPAEKCALELQADSAHQPDYAYLPYLVTGDYYHLEELQFWANFDSFAGNPSYRQYEKGLVQSDQVRGQAWSLRTLAQAAYITPDNDPQKANFTAIVNHNINWYNTAYTNNPIANKLGILDHNIALGYLNGTALGPWQDDFFTSSIGRMVELGFVNAKPLLAWKSKFVVDRMVGEGFCWVQASLYNMKVRDSAKSPIYTSIAEVYRANIPTTELLSVPCGSELMGSLLKRRAGEMAEYAGPNSAQAIMQPALAYAASVNPAAKEAWKLYMARPFQPVYSDQPQFSVVPR